VTIFGPGAVETFDLYSSLNGSVNAQLGVNDGSGGTVSYADPPTAASVQTGVPEPATGGLLAAGLLGLARLRGRRR